jgi:hypothetical protein
MRSGEIINAVRRDNSLFLTGRPKPATAVIATGLLAAFVRLGELPGDQSDRA